MGGLPKLTIEQRNEIITRANGGEFIRQLAKEYGITTTYASKLVNHAKRGIR